MDESIRAQRAHAISVQDRRPDCNGKSEPLKSRCRQSQESEPSAPGESLSGYYFKVPDELIQMLSTLSHAELKVYLVAQHAIQKDRNRGQLSARVIAKRSGLSPRHSCLAARKLRIEKNEGGRGLLLPVAKKNEQKKDSCTGKTIVYRNPFEFKTADNCAPTGQQSELQGTHHRAPTGQQYCAPTGQQHLESLEIHRKTSSSSGFSKHRADEEEDGHLRTFLLNWMDSLYGARGAYGSPPSKLDLREIREQAPGWTDAQIEEGFRQNNTSRQPSPKDPPKGYRYFAKVLENLYKKMNGVPPELPEEQPPTEEDLPSKAQEEPQLEADPIESEIAEQKPKTVPRFDCWQCRDTGKSGFNRSEFCQCETGRNLEEDNRIRDQQWNEWIEIHNAQSSDIKREMDREFFCDETIEKRAELLNRFRQRRQYVPRPMAVYREVDIWKSA